MTAPGKIISEIEAIGAGGGWVFWALIALAFAIAYTLLGLWQARLLPGATLLSPAEWRRLLRDPFAPSETFGSLVRNLALSPDPARLLQEAGRRLFDRPARRFPFAFVMISTAPLVGLLGTVSGMFTTFNGMASNLSEKPIDVISEGIFEALITTETGLIIGIPAFIACAWLKSRHDIQVVRFQQLESRLLGEVGSPSPT